MMCKRDFILILLSLATVTSQLIDSCPSGCECTKKNHLTCRELTSFPTSLESDAEMVSIYLSTLPVIPKNAFQGLPNMKILDIYSVSIGTIDTCAFQHLTNMTRISIYNGKIRTIKKGAFMGLSYDGYFSLYMSEVGTIESYAFSDISKTKSFTIFNSNVTTIESKAFFKFSDLTKFSIYSSNITHIQSGAFEDFTRVESAHFHENTIEKLECNTVDLLIKELEQNFSFDKITLNCDCSLTWLLRAASLYPGLSLQTSVCKLPMSLGGKTVGTLTETQICPSGGTFVTSCPPTSQLQPPTCTTTPPINAGPLSVLNMKLLLCLITLSQAK